ncbi:MAG: hypothetical protein NWP80_01390, partial [Candidatus Gracilibacteria bacterium]|nr:hypothetical protein [Candidatus Gracilibacteria bacterium]
MKKLLVIASILAMFTLASCNNATQNEEEVLMDETNVETIETNNEAEVEVEVIDLETETVETETVETETVETE